MKDKPASTHCYEKCHTATVCGIIVMTRGRLRGDGILPSGNAKLAFSQA